MAYRKLLLCLSILLYPVNVLALEQAPLIGGSAERRFRECEGLATRFRKLVSFQHDVLYQQEQSHYWSARQSDIKPTCRLTPTTTQETADLMQYLHNHNTEIAISNGGHSTVLVASNLDAGITLDLSALSSISLAADKESVEIGTGVLWRDIYSLLDPQGLTVAGARAGSVGVGGFLLGGGVAIAAPRYGWSCDTLDSVEVVLANGSMLNVNQTHHTDLFRALKGGGSNFAIAAHFTMRSFPISSLQVAFVRFEWRQINRLMGEMSSFTRNAHEDVDVSLDLSMAVDSASNEIFAVLMATRFGSIAESVLLQPFFDIPHSPASVNDITPGKLAHEVDLSNPPGYRQHRCTMTIRNNATTIIAIAEAFAAMFTKNGSLRNGVDDDDAYRPAVLIQPISLAQLRHTENSSGNVLGLDQEDEALFLLSFETRWSLASHDSQHTTHLATLLARSREIARAHNTLHEFVYLNYAAAGQNVFELLHRQNPALLGQLRAIRDVYDDRGYLERHVSGAFKLGG